MGTGDTWSFTWHTNEVPNGQYTLQMRGMDQAGNVGDASFHLRWLLITDRPVFPSQNAGGSGKLANLRFLPITSRLPV